MEAITTKVASVVFLLSLIAVLASASGDSSYGKPQYKGYMAPKPAMPKLEPGAYEKGSPKIPTKPAIPHEGYGKSNPTIPSKPVIPKEEHGDYDKINPTTEKIKPQYKGYMAPKPVIPKVEHGAYEKSSPKIPIKPVTSHEGYGKSIPTIPSKPVIPKEEHGDYDKIKPTPEKPKFPKNIAVQGLIYCKYGAKLIPLKGATTRVTCLAVRKNGYESTPFSFSSCPADEKGYFFAKISSSKLIKDDLWEVKECKAFLENSPWTHCKVAEDTNGGISGAHLSFSRILNGYSLASVGPFIYNTGTQLSPKEGY